MTKQKEIWRDIEGYEGLYQVSNLGSMKSCDKIVKFKNGGKREYKSLILKPTVANTGYFVVSLHKNNKRNLVLIHRLVAKAFIPNPERKPEVNHKNGIKTDNRVENLEWVTGAENKKHAYDTNLRKSSTRKLTNEQVKKIRDEYVFGSKEYGCYALARKYGVSYFTIFRIIHHETYKN